jgi:tRNA(Ile)-lysidine synthase
MPPSVDLDSQLRDALAVAPGGALVVGYSGGLDSTVLLHALARQPAARQRGLAAVHVDHGLHPDSSRWAEHCAAFCATLDVALTVVRVEVRDIAELGLEAAARAARRAAFAAHLPDDGVLVLAQHRDDQAETLLLRLLHGGGHEGLGGMQALRRFGRGWSWRPLLDCARAELAAYAARERLGWIEDPANADPRHARNHLRHVVLPALQARWPDAGARIAAAAARLGEEAALLQAQARGALAEAQGSDPSTLALAPLRRQPAALRRLVLGHWLDSLGLPRPPPGIWSRIAPDLLEAAAEATPCLAWRGAELRRYRDLLYAMRPLPEPATAWERAWDGTQALALPPGFGRLELAPARALGPWRVAPRRGGERLQQAGAHRELRTLLQDLGVPPWQRARLPLLFDAQGALQAAGDLALAPAFAAALAAAGTRLRWRCETATHAD